MVDTLLGCLLVARAGGRAGLRSLRLLGGMKARALYPVVTAALARVVLHERLSAWQLIGAGLALLGVLLITIA